MIRHVRLTNWKAYKTLDLELRPGLTFLIARNGVGKTSVLQAIVWALFGSAVSGVDADKARRGDKSATVEVELSLPTVGEVTITRTVEPSSSPGRAPRQHLSFSHPGGRSEGDAEWSRFLSDVWLAPPELLGRLLVMPEHAVWEELSQPAGADLNAEIARLLRLDVLNELRGIAGAEKRKARKLATEARGVSAAALQAARTALEAAQSSYENARVHLAAVELERRSRTERREYLSDYQRWLDDRGRWEDASRNARSRFEELARSIEDLLPEDERESPPTPARIRMVLDARRRSCDEDIAALRAVQELASRYRSQLHDGGDCPACLRILDDATLESATEHHRSVEENARERLTAMREMQARIDVSLGELMSLAVGLESEPPDPPAELDQREAADSSLAELDDDRLVERYLEVESAAERERDLLGARRSQVQSLEADDRAYRQAIAAYSREALAEIVQTTSQAAIERLTTEGADPVVRLIRNQWKRLPEGHSLDVDPSGRIVALREGRWLDYDCLSGGEKARSLLVYRVAALKALSSAPLMLLDEPLEHLDPRNRWSMGRMLMSLVSSGALTQVLLTTYEEALGRKLALLDSFDGVAPEMNLIYVDSSE
jgi:DNA repair exonuclease SbcCD ATPase subunit